MIIGYKDNIIYLLSNDCEIINEIELSTEILTFKVSPNEEFLIIYATEDNINILYIYKILENNIQFFNKIVNPDEENVEENNNLIEMDISPNGKYLALLGFNKIIYIYSLEHSTNLSPIKLVDNIYNTGYTDILKFSDDSSLLMSKIHNEQNIESRTITILFDCENNFDIIKKYTFSPIGFLGDNIILEQNNKIYKLNMFNNTNNNKELIFFNNSEKFTLKFIFNLNKTSFLLYSAIQKEIWIFNLETFQILKYKFMKYVNSIKFIQDDELVLIVNGVLLKLNLNNMVATKISSNILNKHINIEDDSLFLY